MSQKTKLTYKDIYDFVKENNCELLTESYKNMKQHLKIKCSCGNIFETTMDAFKNKNKRCCNECSKNMIKNKNTLSYDYVKSYIESKGCILLSNEYIGARHKLLIKCSCGNEFIRTFNKFKNGQIKCCVCQNRKMWNIQSVKDYCDKLNIKLLSNKYDNKRTMLKFECSCGNEFETEWGNFLYQNKRRCDYCSNKISFMESEVIKYLDDNKINYIHQYKFKDLRTNKSTNDYLSYDFGILNSDDNLIMLIECDGIQHYKPIDYFGGLKAFEKQKYNDELKTQYCKDNNIKLLRISYLEQNNIKDILEENLNNK